MQNKLNKILNWMQEYKISTNCKGVVLGLSGGKDSTVVAMLAKLIFNDNVLAVLMPNGDQKDIQDSIEICKQLNLNNITINIANTYASLIDNIKPNMIVTDKACTNIPPRLRMTTLYAIAQSIGYRVIGTGNKSEAYIGWTTKFGDSAYDFNPIGDLLCTEVIEIGKILAKQFNLDIKFIEKKPSDGLCGKSDEDSFGFTYSQLDNFILGNKCNLDSNIKKSISEKHLISAHKRVLPKVCIFNECEELD